MSSRFNRLGGGALGGALVLFGCGNVTFTEVAGGDASTADGGKRADAGADADKPARDAPAGQHHVAVDAATSWCATNNPKAYFCDDFDEYTSSVALPSPPWMLSGKDALFVSDQVSLSTPQAAAVTIGASGFSTSFVAHPVTLGSAVPGVVAEVDVYLQPAAGAEVLGGVGSVFQLQVAGITYQLWYEDGGGGALSVEQKASGPSVALGYVKDSSTGNDLQFGSASWQHIRMEVGGGSLSVQVSPPGVMQPSGSLRVAPSSGGLVLNPLGPGGVVSVVLGVDGYVAKAGSGPYGGNVYYDDVVVHAP